MNIISTIENFINRTKENITKIASETNFTKRKGNIKPETFFLTMTVGQAELHEISLNTLAEKTSTFQENLEISKQAMFQRMEAGADFMNELYKEAFEDITKKSMHLETIEVLKQFKDVKLTDGTTISLPDKLKGLYKGLGGKNAISAIKLQVTYSILTNTITAIDDFSATVNDTKYNQTTLKNIEANELYIKDLGYYDGNYFEDIDKAGAYFLSKIKKSTHLYEIKNNKYEEINIAKMLKKSVDIIDRNVYIKKSSGSMYEVRITGIKLPEKIRNERKRKAYKEAKKKGKQLTEKEIQMLDWFLIITNVPSDMLDAKTIGECYRIRWQVELVFKALKSSFDFDKFGKPGLAYFRCLFYGKLIILLLTMHIFSICRAIYFKDKGKLISVQKFIKFFRNNIEYLSSILKEPTKKNYQKFNKKLSSISKKSVFESRRRKTSEEVLISHDLPESVLIILAS
jgi:hypothetical protein